MNSLTDCFKMHNGVEIPCIGFGTWKTPNGEVAVESVKEAIAAGYRHIDTAACYGNEESVGKAIQECGLPREELFITSKLWNDQQGYDTTLAAFEKTMDLLKLDYLDLYLIHWPITKYNRPDWKTANRETWRAFEKLYEEGRIKAIGLSNFMPHHCDNILANANIKPMVDQIELHPGLIQEETRAYCKEHDIVVEAWSPLGSGKIFESKTMKEIAEKYGKSIAQICVRWCLQHDVLPLPKSVTPSRIAENAKVFDFEISCEDMARIDAVDEIGRTGTHPDEVYDY